MDAHHSWVEMQRLRMAAPHFGMETPLRGRSGGHTGNRPYHSKHTSPFRKGEYKSFNACGASANGKTKKLALAELPQITKQKI